MKKLAVVLATIAAAGIIPATADASHIRECGDMKFLNIYNVTTRHISFCRQARELAIGYTRYGRKSLRYPPFRGTRFSVHVREYTKVGCCTTKDVRVSNGWNVLHFQYEIDW